MLLVSATEPRDVVIAASNSYDDGIHAAGKVTAGDTSRLNLGCRLDFSRPKLPRYAIRIKVELYGPNGAILATRPAKPSRW